MSAAWWLALVAMLAVGCTPEGGGGGDDDEDGAVMGADGGIDEGAGPVEMAEVGDGGEPTFDLGFEVDEGLEVDEGFEVDVGVEPDADLVEGEACTNDEDTAALDAAAETLADTIGECAFMCLGGGAPCAADCMETEVGVTTGCASCFGQIIACTIMNCAGQCFDATSPACAECREANCNPAFVACAGIDPQ